MPPPIRSALPPGISREFLLQHRICPIGSGEGESLDMAIAPTGDESAAHDVGVFLQRPVQLQRVTDDEMDRLIARLGGDSADVDERPADDGRDDINAADVRALANQPPVARYVSMIMHDAIDARASDVHLEATREGLIARYRLDGVLVPAPSPEPELQKAIVSRIKLLAELDIAERRRPQDGRIRLRLEDNDIDLRVSTVPTMHGESVVLRILDQGGRPATLEELGMSVPVQSAFQRFTSRPHGLILVTGPTGSGKTTTLYASITRRDAESEKIITVEDPIEYQLPGILQVPVHRAAGVTFGSVLRSILRHDPDVIMVGEMRDRETAELAVQAAMTGHLVLSTLHTNDAVGAIPRLIDLGIPPYLVAATVECVVAQRLVRRVCPACTVAYQPTREAIAQVSAESATVTSLTRGAGCRDCRGSGFRGRIGLFEMFWIDDDMRDAIVRGATRAQLRELAGESGIPTLREDGWEKARNGVTTVEEVIRVTQA